MGIPGGWFTFGTGSSSRISGDLGSVWKPQRVSFSGSMGSRIKTSESRKHKPRPIERLGRGFFCFRFLCWHGFCMLQHQCQNLLLTFARAGRVARTMPINSPINEKKRRALLRMKPETKRAERYATKEESAAFGINPSATRNPVDLRRNNE